MSKRTFQPNNRRRAKTHGFRAAHAYPGRPGHRLGSAPQGPQRAVGLIRRGRSARRQLVLPSANRMRRSTDFSTVVRDGLRVRNGGVVVHFDVVHFDVVHFDVVHFDVVHPDAVDFGAHVKPADEGFTASPVPLVGLVVGKSVGNSVVRHRVSRRLRAQLHERLDLLPVGSRIVVRALPQAARATSRQLGADIDRAFARSARP